MLFDLSGTTRRGSVPLPVSYANSTGRARPRRRGNERGERERANAESPAGMITRRKNPVRRDRRRISTFSAVGHYWLNRHRRRAGFPTPIRTLRTAAIRGARANDNVTPFNYNSPSSTVRLFRSFLRRRLFIVISARARSVYGR